MPKGRQAGVHYRVHSTKVKCLRWYPTRAAAIAAFERASKRAGIAPPECGDSITNTHPLQFSLRYDGRPRAGMAGVRGGSSVSLGRARLLLERLERLRQVSLGYVGSLVFGDSQRFLDNTFQP